MKKLSDLALSLALVGASLAVALVLPVPAADRAEAAIPPTPPLGAATRPTEDAGAPVADRRKPADRARYFRPAQLA